MVSVWTLLTIGTYFFLNENHYWIVQYLHWVPILGSLLYILGFSFGFGPVPWLMMGEILPLSIRGFAAGLLSSYNWLCSAIVQMFFLFFLGKILQFFPSFDVRSQIHLLNPSTDTLNDSGTFWLFGGFCVLGFYTISLVPETKGKSLEIIEAELLSDTEPVGFVETMELI